MKSRVSKLCLMLFMMMLVSVTAFAQKKTVSGTVVDGTGEPVIGANVVESSTNGTVTNIDGQFTLQNVAENAVLKISFIGYATQEISVAGKTKINVVLEEEGEDLDEVVVVGYGVQKKRDLTGSVASIKQSDMQQVATSNVMQALQAKVPGVDLSQSDGQAGSGVSITLRGNRSIMASNSPLILVDGVEYGSTLDVPASDIESMDILKDAASTAIYGTKGANGVIIITTKRGNKESKTNVNYSGYVSFNSPTGVVKPMYGDKEVQRLIDAKNYKDAAANSWDFSSANNTIETTIGTAAERNGIYLIKDVISDGSYADWMDEILKNSVSQNHEVSVSGGNKSTNFNASLSVRDDNGMLKNDEMKRYTGRANFDHEINKHVKVGTSLSFAYKSNDKRNSGVYNLALKMTSITHAYLPDGTIHEKPSYFYDAHANPLLDEVDGAYQRNIESTRFFGSAYLQITPIKNMILKSNFTVDRSNSRDGLYQDYASVGRHQTPHTSGISLNNSINTKYVWQNTANYSFKLDKNDFTFLLGNEVTQSVKETSGISGDAGEEHYFNSSFYDVSKIGTATVSSTYVKSSMLSFFGRVNYSYASRYLFQASLRSDGSSTLADGHQWGVFPSVSAGWRIIDEDWMESTKDWLDNLKLRVSWGLSGNAAIDPYMTLATVNQITNNSTYKAPMTLANTELTWEKTSALDFGLDMSFLGNRLTAGIDFYKNNTFDLLYYKTAPAASVYTSTMANVGKTKGQGLEISLGGMPVRTDDFMWNIDASLTMANDEVDELVDGINEVISGNQILRIGEPLSAFYQYEADGCWNIGEFDEYIKQYGVDGNGDSNFKKPNTNYGNPGTVKIVDQNHDGVIDEDDKIVYRQSPKAIIGMTNSFSYKGLNLSVQMMARLGGYMNYGGYGLYTYDNSNWGDLDYWTPSNTGAIIPSPGAGAEYQDAVKIQRADYFKVKDITLSYDFKKALLKKAYIDKARVYCSLKNFITASKIDGYDSERNGSVTFPLAKQVVVGLNLTF